MGWREQQRINQRAEYARLVRCKLCVTCYEKATAGVRCRRCKDRVNQQRADARRRRNMTIGTNHAEASRFSRHTSPWPC